MVLPTIFYGFLIYFVVRCLLAGFYVVQQNERAVKTRFGRAERLGDATTLGMPDFAESLSKDEQERYRFPQLKVIPPGGPYFKFPWESIHKVSVATELIDIAFDPDNPVANQNNTILEAVTKDQLNINLRGQLRYTVSERNLYAYLFGVANPVSHVIGYFISILRERIANYEAPANVSSELSIVASYGTSINDLRKNLGDLNSHMEEECRSSAARYGITLDAALMTALEPPQEVESALAAINTAHNHVSSEVSLAQAGADQKIVQSRRAVEIETFKANAEVQLLARLASQLFEIKNSGAKTLPAYVRNVKLAMLTKAKRIIFEPKK